MHRLYQYSAFLTQREYLIRPVKVILPKGTTNSTSIHHIMGMCWIMHAALDQEWVQLLTEGLKQLSTREVLEMIIKDQSLKTVLP